MLVVAVNDREVADLRQSLSNVTDNVSKEAGLIAWKVAKNTKSFIAKIVVNEMGVQVKQKDVKKVLKEKRFPTHSVVTIDPSGGLPLNRYKRYRQTKAGIVYAPYKGQLSTREDAFMVEKWGRAAYKRTGPKRTPIEKQFGPSPWSEFFKSGGIARTTEHIRERVKYELNERMRYLSLKKAGVI